MTKAQGLVSAGKRETCWVSSSWAPHGKQQQEKIGFMETGVVADAEMGSK